MITLPKTAIGIISYFKKNGFECYIVGGYVRDFLLKKIKDEASALDFTTNATPQEILKLFKDGKYENEFGTVIVSLEAISQEIGLKKNEYTEGEFVEITTYRTEQNYTDKRHPDRVKWGKTIEEDLIRRDFTINAMATDGEKIIDLFGGQVDLEKKIIRAIGNPHERFAEDALRMMRAIRFAGQLGFSIEEKTLEAIAQLHDSLSYISFERIRDEFLKILASDHPSEGVMLLKNTDLLKTFLPELYDCFGIGQVSPKRHHIYDVGTHLIKTLEACTNPDPIVRLAALIHDIGKPATRKILPDGVVTFYNHEIVGTEIAYEIGRRLRLSKKQLIKLTKLVRFHQFLVTKEQTDSAIRRFIRELGPEYVTDMIDLRVADRIGSGSKPTSWRLELFKERLIEVQKKPFTVHDLKITGHDVMKLFNMKPGREIGDILDKVFEEVVEGRLKNEKEELLTYLKKIDR